MSEPLFESERLSLREMDESDAGFYLAMLTDPDFKRHIADRGVRTEAQALDNLRDRVLASYDAHGFGAGYATEASAAVMGYAAQHYGLTRLAAIVSPANAASIRVLERLGFESRGQVQFPDGGEMTNLYSVEL